MIRKPRVRSPVPNRSPKAVRKGIATLSGSIPSFQTIWTIQSATKRRIITCNERGTHSIQCTILMMSLLINSPVSLSLSLSPSLPLITCNSAQMRYPIKNSRVSVVCPACNRAMANRKRAEPGITIITSNFAVLECDPPRKNVLSGPRYLWGELG